MGMAFGFGKETLRFTGFKALGFEETLVKARKRLGRKDEKKCLTWKHTIKRHGVVRFAMMKALFLT